MDEASFLDLLSGRRRGMRACLFRGGLSALSGPYALAMRARNRAFDLGLKKTHRVSMPVVSVGNLTTGGTGKTPLVAHLANWFLQQGRKPALLSRGYRSLDGQANDEKLVLDRLCPGVPHLQDPDRVASAQRAITEHVADVLILDDGFQHRRLGRDLDIVLIDATNPWGYGHVLPRGLLREPLSGLRRADLVVVTRADQVSHDKLAAIRARIGQLAPSRPVVEVAYPPDGLIGLGGERAEFASLHGRPLAAFCGIGNPAGFRRTLDDAGCHMSDDAFTTFSDHHHYTSADRQAIAARAADVNAAAVLTTLKDLVKIAPAEWNGPPLWAVGIGVAVHAGGDALEERLQRLATPSAQGA